ncbi:MAG TPA: alginate export family protein [Gemmataceae bacterium]
MAPGPAPDAAATEPAGPCDACKQFDFSKVPPSIRALPRPGLFPLPPTGPGYYSALDFLTGAYRDGPPQYPYPPFALSPLSFYDADWRFVDKPGYDPDFLEQLKRVRVGDNWLFATGGQAWVRYSNEYNSRLTESNNVYSLVRVRPYVDLWYQDCFRVFVEGIFADNLWHDIPPLGTDVDRGDFQNLFVEAKVAEVGDRPVFVRAGRQEVSLGSLRLVGTPDWGNTRRTWDGVRAFRVGENWDVDLFWLQPVFPNATELNSADHQQNFAGSWVTYRPRKGTFVDAYYLMLDNDNRVTQTGIVRAPFTIHTIGGRYASDFDDRFLWETEGAIQLGEVNSAPVVAGMYSGGLGYHAKEVAWNPTFWAYYNYTSGDNDPNAGTYHTFNQLFPFIHYYMGWVDAVGRQNNLDLNLRLYLYPAKWVTVWLQYHHFWLAEPKDALYGIAGNAYRATRPGWRGRTWAKRRKS